MNTLTKKDKLALQVSLALVAGMFSLTPVVHGAPVLEQVVTGGAKVHQTVTNTTAIVPDSNANGVTNNVINWQDFSVGSNEKVIFDAADAAGSSYTKTNNYLNIVTGNGTSYVNGAMKGGNNVYLVNPNGVIMGKNADIDVGNLYVSTKNLNPDDFIGKDLSKGASVLGTTAPEAEVVNMGRIQANSVYVEGTVVHFIDTANVLYKGVNDTSETVSNDLLSSNNSSSGVTINATDRAVVGYSRTAFVEGNKATYATYTANDTITGKSASDLGYKHNSSYKDIDSYMHVHNASELKNINNALTENYMLVDNIKYSQTAGNHSPIGTATDNADGTINFTKAFSGKFEGNFHTITNIRPTATAYAGLFGCTNKAEIYDLGVINPWVSTSEYAGGIAGYAKDSKFENVYVKHVTSGNDKAQIVAQRVNNLYTNAKAIGGIIGYADNTVISSVYNNGVGVYSGAGIVGSLNNSSELKNAYNTGTIYLSTTDKGNTKVINHYGIYDYADSGSSVENVYNTGKTTNQQNHSSSVLNVGALESNVLVSDIDPSKKATNAYVVSDGDTEYMSASHYGFFVNESGKTVTATDDWRIYEGHTLPLLRSFLKANGKGTVPVGYNLALYAEATAKTAEDGTVTYTASGSPTAKLKGSSADGTIVYNGYYIGGSDVEMDTSRGLDSTKVKSNTSALIKNVDDVATFFYSTGQDGYDLASDSLKVVARPIGKADGDVTNVDKVYDGTTNAAAALENKFGKTINLLDYQESTSDGVPVVTDPGYGIVEVYKSDGTTLAHTDDVMLDTSFIQSANYDTADVTVEDVVNTGHPNLSVITVTPKEGVEAALRSHQEGESGYVADRAKDYKNYSIKTSDVTGIKITGDITQRPVIVSLNQSTGINKIYDGTSQIVDAKGPEDTSVTHTYKTGNVKVEKYKENNDTGIVLNSEGAPEVAVTVSDAYYSTDGTAANKVSNATPTGADPYKAAYALAFEGDATKIANYSFQDTSGNALTDNTLMGTGTIAKRTVYASSAKFTDAAGNVVDNRKVYDYTSTYDEAKQVSFETTGGIVEKNDAVAQTYINGILRGHEGLFAFQLDGEGKFYNADKSAEANEVDTAKYVRYGIKASGTSDILSNYKLSDGTTTYSLGDTIYVFQDKDGANTANTAAGIDKRSLSLKLNENINIDKIYDGTADLKNTTSRDFASHTDNNSNGNVTYADGSLQKIAADGTAWSINAAYQQTGAESAAKDVRKENGVVVENGKNINYQVALTGEYADNYTLKVEGSDTGYDQGGTESNPASFTATGKITPVTINKVVFGDVKKSYDGTTWVGKAASETGSIQDGNHITITGVTDGTNSVLVSGETLQDVFGTNGTETIANGIQYNGSAITGNYGNTVAYNSNNTDLFDSTNGEHAYAIGTNTGGASRYVQYTGLSNAVVNDNYVIEDDTQYGKGKITPLTITSLSYGNIGESEKVYDGNSSLIGGYKVTYNDDGTVNTATLQTSATGAATIGALTGSHTSLGITELPLGYTVNTDSYFAKADGTATANAGEATKTVYSINVLDSSGYGDYVLGMAEDSSYTNGTSAGVALINGIGSIKPRRVYVDGVTQTKTYDKSTTISGTGDSVVTMSAGTETEPVTGLLAADQGKNSSTAVYSADAGAGYDADDANWDTNTNALFRDDAKTVTFTPSLSSNGSNYEFYHSGDGLVSSFGTTGHVIKQRDLQVTFEDIKKTFDANNYVKDNGDNHVTLTSGTGDPVYTALNGDTVTLETRNTSQFLPLAGAEDASSVYAGTHDVRYDLKVSGDDYENYRLVNGRGAALATGTYEEGGTNYAGATGSGVGVIDPASANTANATFEDITKVYDGNNKVTYKHIAGDTTADAIGGYDDDQVKTDNSYHVRSLALGMNGSNTYNLADTQYTILEALYNDGNVGNDKGITYKFQITDTSFLNNVDLSGLSTNYGYNSTDHTFYFGAHGSITPKNVYATLSSAGQAANPTKTYDKNNTVLGLATNNGSVVNQATANSYVNIAGLVPEDNAYTVTPEYQNVNVATDSAGNVVTGGNDIKYNIAVSDNYKLYTNDYANRSENQYLIGTGTITPKEISLSATNVAMKTYDAATDVKLESGSGVVVPTFAIDTGISGDSITVSAADLSGGTYGNYENSAFTPNANVKVESDGSVGYKAVQYTGVDSALRAGEGTKLTNYKLASGNGGIYSAADDGTVTFATGKGMINKLGLSAISANVDTVSKVYDGTGSLTYDHRADASYGDESQRNTYANAEDSVNYLVLTPVSGSEVRLDYNNGNNGYTLDTAQTYFDDPNAGTNKTITYTFNIDKDVMNNFDLRAFNYLTNRVTAGSDGNYIKKHGSAGNTITQKNIYATLTDLATSSAPTKVYNGLRDVVDNSQSNPTGTAKDVSGYMKVTGLVNDDATNVHDTATITAEYENPDVKENGSWVKYTATITNPNNYKLFTKNAEGVVVDAEGNATDDVNNVLKGKGTITPKNLTLTSDLALKTYDQTANVKLPGSETEAGDIIPTLGLSGQVADGDVAVTFDANNEEAGGKYGIYENGEFTPDANVAFDGNGNVTYKAVQYKGLKLADGNVAATNYALPDTVVFAASEGKGWITKRGISSISAEMEAVTKAYDGNDKVAYDHTKADDYFAGGQNDAKDAVRAIRSLTLSSDVGGPFYLDADDYTVDNNTAVYLGDNAAGFGVGKNAQYRLKINSDVGSNYTLSGAALTGTGKYVSGVTNDDGSYTLVSSDNVIEQKKVYASVDPKANPTKTYSGDEVVYGWAKDGDSTVTAETVKDFVKINGLVTGDDNYNVEASYQNKNVATEGEGDAKHVVAEKNYIDYQVSGLSDNYELFPEGGDNSSTTVTVTGKGTITPKKLTVTAEKAQKVYDQTANVKMTADDENYETGDTLPDLKVEGLMAEGDVTLNNAKVTGLYLNDSLEEDANVAFDNDGNVAYKAVRYSNLSGALKDGKVAATNYTIGYGKDGTYDAASDTLTFEAEAEKGKITQRAINSVTADIGTVTKVYDGNKSLAYDHTYDDGYRGTQIGQGEAGTAIRNLTFSNSLRDFNLGLKDLTIDEANTHYLTANAEGGKAVTYQFSVNNDILRNYTLNGVTVNGAENSSVTDGVMNGDGSFTFNTKDNVIEKKNIYASLDNTANPTKVYDGRDVVIGKSVNNGKVIDQKAANDLVSFIGMREGEDSYTVTPTYKNKNVLNAGDNLVDYVISGYSDNYKLYTGGDTPGDTLTGQGTITKRPVYVVDKDGDSVITKEYNGDAKLYLPEGTVLGDRFELGKADENTGLVVNEVTDDSKIELDKAAITGIYVDNDNNADKNVARDSSGNVVNKAVKFEGFGLKGEGKDNYFLTAKDTTGTVDLTGEYGKDDSAVNYGLAADGSVAYVTEMEGGRIKPKDIAISVKKSPTKVYNQDQLVKNEYDEDGNLVYDYATASNLEAAADKAVISRSFDTANKSLNLGIEFEDSGEKDSFNVKVEGTPVYEKSRTDKGAEDVHRAKDGTVQQDKVTSYNISWTNQNYNLVGEAASDTSDHTPDTFVADGIEGYTHEGGNKRSGVLKDYEGEITPYKLSVNSMNAEKTYNGSKTEVSNPGPDVTVSFGKEADEFISNDIARGGNINDPKEFVGLSVAKGEFGLPTQAAKDEALAEEAAVNKKATEDEVKAAKPWDAAFNRTADPFQHQVAYSGIAITNGNYELADDEFDGTGTINRAVVTAHPKSATIKAGEAMPSFKGTLDGFMDGETMPKIFYTTVENEDGTTTTTSETRQVPLSEYYNDPEFIYWGPEDGVTNRTEGKNNVYGWYLRKEVGEDKDGNEVVSYYKEKEANLDKNYTLVQAEEPSTLVVEPAPRSGGGGGSGSIVSPPVRESTPVYITPPVRESTPVYITPSVPTPAAPQPQPVLEVGYVEKPVVADSSVYQNVSKDTSNSANPEAQAAIQYGRKGTGIAAGNDDSGKSSTIAIELAEVVNLLGGDVASDGSMSLTNTDSGRKLSVGSTEEGYLSVGAERKEGSIGIETEGENILEEMAAKEGSIGIESEEAQAEVRTEDKEGQIELETEEEMLDAEGKKSSISLRSEGRDGESEITYSDGDLSILNSLNADKKKEQKGEEDEEDSEKSESREGEAAIAYNDVA